MLTVKTIPPPSKYKYRVDTFARANTALAALIAILFSVTAGPTLADPAPPCTVYGTLYRPDGTHAANETVTLLKTEQNGAIVSNTAVNMQTDGSGFISFNAT